MHLAMSYSKPVATAQPTVTGGPGFPALSSGVNASAGTWSGSPTQIVYQWQVCNSLGGNCLNISGASQSGYTLAAPVAVGNRVRIKVLAKNSVGWGAAYSQPSAQVTGVPYNIPSSPPTISGIAAQGSTLSVTSNGVWASSPTKYAFQWQDCTGSGTGCVNITGATGGSYVLVSGDVGHSVRVQVTASNSYGAGQPAVSSTTAAVSPPSAPSGITTTSTTTTSSPTTTTTTTSLTTTTSSTTTPTTTTTTTTPTTTTTSTTTSSPSIPAHTETWGYDDCGNGGVGASSSLVRQWLSFAETNCGPGGDTKALADCHSGGTVYCRVMQYLDTDILYYGYGASPQWSGWSPTASESWYLHVPGSTTTRLSTSAYGGGYFDNQANPAVQAFYQSYVRANYPNEDGLFMDDQAPGIGVQFYSASNGTSSNEISSDPALQAAHASMSAAMTKSNGAPYPQVDNTIPDGGNPYESNQGVNMVSGSVQGLLAEGAPMVNGSFDPFYPGLLDDIAYVNTKTSGYTILLPYGPAGASYQAQSRRVEEGTVLLGYAPGRVVSWAELEQGNNNLAVWPESGIYPTQPRQTMGIPAGSGCLAGSGSYCSSGGHNDLQVASGVYRREFAACYNKGVAFGSCAVIVNSTGSPVTVQPSWLTQTYRNQITLSGGDVQAGGTINLTGAAFAAGSTVVGAHDALLLAP